MFFATAATATATATAATARTRPAGSGEEAVDAKGHSEPGVSQAPPRQRTDAVSIDDGSIHERTLN